jgi:SAM-dependent methyltransferase
VAFQVAVAVAVLEFVADPALAVAELSRVVRPGGRVVIGALNPRSPWGVARRRELREPPWNTARFLCRHELRELARPYGRGTVRGVLFARGPLPRLTPAGTADRAARSPSVPSTGAFQVLTIDRREQ